MENKIHYSRYGYEGNYTYVSVCGKEVKTHQDKEGSSINPLEANCKKCLETKEYITDKNDCLNTPDNIKRRIYIESDILHADELRGAQRSVRNFLKKDGLEYVERMFSEVLNYAWHDLEKTWDAVKKADEIYADSSLMPLSGGSYNGAPLIFNEMCERAIKEGIKGKSVIILNSVKNIYWDMIDIPKMKKAFKDNDLYMYDEEHELSKINVKKIKK